MRRFGFRSSAVPPAHHPASHCARILRRLQRSWKALRRGDDGVSAVEFGLFAPVLFFALVASADLGLAEYERMTIDHALRAGAQSAMADQGTEEVKKVVRSTALKNFNVADGASAGADALSLDVTRFCACASAPSVPVACSTTCTTPAHTFIYYRLTGTKVYRPMILPAMTLTPAVQVQIR